MRNIYLHICRRIKELEQIKLVDITSKEYKEWLMLKQEKKVIQEILGA